MNLSLSEKERQEQRKIQLFTPLSDTERGWGRGQIRLVELTLKNYGKLPPAICYPGQLNQVFMNILSNAIDALEDANQQRTPTEIDLHPNTIWIHTCLVSENQIKISIADNGLGVPDTIITRLFDPFFTTKNVGKGSGLGLTISYQIVTELHLGKLNCNSTQGLGAEFVVTLPLKAKKIQQQQVNQ
ncbi:ATP-binding protein [Nostoc sp. UIC 10630]|uniref:sensor histidine kinase n=1 Tax=Nostoc sp. UIC 10630 TaxID=2100146 RepID=UPI0013D8998B|nr:ATP-binding protein [Nostoc sp. UIC 10630]NEU78920.1 hypothetical protein [Nostoc sp. UIC 10630]